MNENKEEIISGSAISRLVLAHKYKRKEIFNYEECSFILNKLIEKDKEIERLNNIIDELEKELNKEIEFNNFKNGVRKLDKKLTQGGYLYRDYIKELLIELEKSK